MPSTYLYPGTFVESISDLATIQAQPVDVARAYLILTTGNPPSDGYNKPVLVKSETDFTTKFGSTPASPSLAYLRYLFLLFDKIELYVISARDSAVTVPANTIPTLNKAHYLAAIAALDRDYQLPGLVLIPEVAAITLQADRTQIWNAVNSEGSMIGVIDAASATASNAAAIAESDAYGAIIRGFFVYGTVKDSANNNIPISAVVAGHALKAIYESGVQRKYPSPANKYLVPTTAATPVVTDSDRSSLYPKSINTLKFLPGYGFSLFGDRMLNRNADNGALQFNSMMVQIAVEESLRRVGVVFELDDSASQERQKAAAGSVMESIADRGGFKPGVVLKRPLDMGGGVILPTGFVVSDGYLVGSPFVDGTVSRIRIAYAPVGSIEVIVYEVARIG